MGIHKEKREHPTQKPLELIKWCILQAEKDVMINTILDPFMGSGTTLRAAKDLGRKAIGIEIEEKYCEIAARQDEEGDRSNYYETLAEALWWVVNIFGPKYLIRIEDHNEDPPVVWPS
jgi:DNA modification methylase